MQVLKKTVAGILSGALLFTAVSPLYAADTKEAQPKSAAEGSTLDLAVEAKDSSGTYKLPLEEVSLSVDTFAMANIAAEADVYSAADAASPVCGKIYPTTSMEVLSKDETWAQIQTGNLTGYVPVASLMFGDEGRVLMNAKCEKACVATEATALYASADASAQKTADIAEGEVYTVKAQLSGWVEVARGEEAGAFVPADAVRVEAQTAVGKTTEELAAEAAAAEAAQAAAEAEAAAAEAAAQATTAAAQVTYGEAVTASTSDAELLACLLYCEAGTDFEACAAVGAVVMNRVKSPLFPNTISEVIYQSGQFSPASSGKLARTLESGVPQSCHDAAVAAISGYSNVGDCLYFRAGTNGTYVIGGNAFR